MTLVQVAEALAEEMERTISAFENRGKGGMQTSFHGDFANAPPSCIVKFRWWAREIRTALADSAALLRERDEMRRALEGYLADHGLMCKCALCVKARAALESKP